MPVSQFLRGEVFVPVFGQIFGRRLDGGKVFTQVARLTRVCLERRRNRLDPTTVHWDARFVARFFSQRFLTFLRPIFLFSAFLFRHVSSEYSSPLKINGR
jgi:hypothetical protein